MKISRRGKRLKSSSPHPAIGSWRTLVILQLRVRMKMALKRKVVMSVNLVDFLEVALKDIDGQKHPSRSTRLNA